MLYKEDWDIVKTRFDAFWNRDIIDRCCIAITSPKKNSNWSKYYEKYDIERFEDNDTDSIQHWWCDPEENVKRNEFIFQNTFYGGEALPIAFTNWGAMSMCSFLGCEPCFNKKSVWYHKVIKDWDSWEWNFDRNNNEYWKITKDITTAFAQEGKDKFFAGLPELGSAADLISLMRGMDDMCLDMYDNPIQLKNAIRKLTDIFLELQNELYEIVKPTNAGGGVLPWMSLWMPGKHGNQLACDFSSVISNEMFKEYFLQELHEESSWTDYATYHLDGPMCMKNHLDTLLEIERIKAIEWTPGIGSPLASDPRYIPEYKKIQQKGKQLVLIAEPQEIDFLTSTLNPKGLFIKTYASCEEDARDIIKIVERNSKGAMLL